METTFKVGDKVLIKGGSDVFTITDISASRVHISNGMSWLLVIASDLTSIPEYPVDWQAGVSFVGPYKLPNSATISGKTYPIPDEKLDQVKKLVEPGLPKWDEIPSEIASNIPYYLKIAANFVNEGWKPDWENANQVKYYLIFCDGKFRPHWANEVSQGVPTFKSRESALRAVEIFRFNGDYDRLVKFYQQ